MKKGPWPTLAMTASTPLGSAARMAMPALAGALRGGLLLALSAQVRVLVPGTDVPMTLQPLAVLVIGLVLPPGQALSAVVLYLVCGTFWLPVFAAGSAGILGPTGGYLVGFAVAAWVVSALRGAGGAATARLAVAGTVGMVIIFALGVSWRAVWLGGDLTVAVATGLIPFTAKAVLEVALAVTLVAAWGSRHDSRAEDRAR